MQGAFSIRPLLAIMFLFAAFDVEQYVIVSYL